MPKTLLVMPVAFWDSLVTVLEDISKSRWWRVINCNLKGIGGEKGKNGYLTERAELVAPHNRGPCVIART